MALPFPHATTERVLEREAPGVQAQPAHGVGGRTDHLMPPAAGLYEMRAKGHIFITESLTTRPG